MAGDGLLPKTKSPVGIDDDSGAGAPKEKPPGEGAALKLG